MVELISLFHRKRLPTGLKLLPVLIYLPVGLILGLLRFFIGLQTLLASNLLQRLSHIRLCVLRGLCTTLGLIIREQDTKFKDESVPVIVSNQVSVIDPIALHLVTGRPILGSRGLPVLIQQAFSIKAGDSQDERVCVLPEGFITNGKGLLRFSSWPMNLSENFQPVAVKIWRPPLVEISPSILGSSYLNDLFWFLVTPCTVITIRYLPVVKKNSEEPVEELTKKLENKIASVLNVPVTNFTADDVKELLKKTSKPTIVKKPAVNPILVARVKEVLPNVDIKLITAELVKTRDVDLVISKLLEKPAKPKEELEKFPKNAQDRMLSFQQRKAQLLAAAKKKYMEKHALNVMNGS